MRNRVQFERMDNESRRYDIEVAREMLFEKGINVSSIKLDRVLGPTSAVLHVYVSLISLVRKY
jgi:hypothetical protein